MKKALLRLRNERPLIAVGGTFTFEATAALTAHGALIVSADNFLDGRVCRVDPWRK